MPRSRISEWAMLMLTALLALMGFAAVGWQGI
ncbi:MAG: IPTL-CTERM sorting domain-containing protein [Geobacteraceae bacterium]|nr:MAG: IPTL-CTERM sorting domain-containing protein [Geobacteraceae bacterium]RPI72346.1 MAG: IPTL-CTERM sorting domain-containing protein [Geobacteraceae bacterium]